MWSWLPSPSLEQAEEDRRAQEAEQRRADRQREEWQQRLARGFGDPARPTPAPPTTPPLPKRPGLARALLALTDPDDETARYHALILAVVDREESERLVLDEEGWMLGGLVATWEARGVELAWETLHTRGLVPDGERVFACARCDGRGRATPPFTVSSTGKEPAAPCLACVGADTALHPTSLDGLLAWVSLGREQIDTDEALAREALERFALNGGSRRVTWRMRAPRGVMVVDQGVGRRGFVVLAEPGTEGEQRYLEPVRGLWQRGIEVSSIGEGGITISVPAVGWEPAQK